MSIVNTSGEDNSCPGIRNICWGLILYFILFTVLTLLGRLAFFFVEVNIYGWIVGIGNFLAVVSLFVGLCLFSYGIKSLEKQGVLSEGSRKIRIGVLLGLVCIVVRPLSYALNMGVGVDMILLQVGTVLIEALNLGMYICWLQGFTEMQKKRQSDPVKLLHGLTWLMIVLSAGSIIFRFVFAFRFASQIMFVGYFSVAYMVWSYIASIVYVLVGIYSIRSWKALFVMRMKE